MASASDRFEVVHDLAAIDAAAWNTLAGTNPFMRHEYLLALQATGCASKRRGWNAAHLTLVRDGQLAGAMPLYVKTHSRGEFVFDYAWANAFERHGMAYYPKLVCSVPFTPVTGPRLLATTTADRVALAHAAAQLARSLELSSLHVLFPCEEDARALATAGFLIREGIQFHWQDQDYPSFDAFLASMNHEKRKKLKQDRRYVAEAGVTFRHLRGAAITPAHLDFFFRCYQSTYAAHGSSPYLTLAFFQALLAEWGDVLLVLAERDGVPIASALNVISGDTMYGRHWGCLEFVRGLHFETCYSQGIEFCIGAGVRRFEGGAQGAHKMSRGLLPTITRSAHWIADPRFADAIGAFLADETAMIEDHLEEMVAHTPFKARDDAG